MEEGDVRRGGCERRMTTFFGLWCALKGLKKGEWSKDQFEHNVHVIHITRKRGKKKFFDLHLDDFLEVVLVVGVEFLSYTNCI